MGGDACGRVKSNASEQAGGQVGRWQVGERQVVEADGKWENTKECINREPLSCI